MNRLITKIAKNYYIVDKNLEFCKHELLESVLALSKIPIPLEKSEFKYRENAQYRNQYDHYKTRNGMFISNNRERKNGWHSLHGQRLFEISIIAKLKQVFSNHNVGIRCFLSYLNKGLDRKHIDEKENFCGLNFMLHDCNAITFVEDGEHEESYKTIAGDVWLIDNTKPHLIATESTRLALNVGIETSFNKAESILRDIFNENCC